MGQGNPRQGNVAALGKLRSLLLFSLLLLLRFFVLFFSAWKVPGKGSDCLEQIWMAPGLSLGR